MKSTRILLLIALLPLACAEEDTTSGTDTASGDATVSDTSEQDTTSPTVNAILEPDCAPNDGPAIRLVVPADPTNATCDFDVSTADHTYVYLFSNLPIEAPETFDLATGASAAVCGPLVDPTSCEDATGGSITFDTYEQGTSGTGSYELILPSGTETGSFNAIWCANPALLCG